MLETHFEFGCLHRSLVGDSLRGCLLSKVYLLIRSIKYKLIIKLITIDEGTNLLGIISP
jgi:hypothetical protein